MLKLYHQGSSVCAAKVRIVLYEKNLDWQGEYIDVLKGEQFDPAYMKLNPNAVVPTLDHDGRIIIESTVICEYLDDVFPDPVLRPQAPFDLAGMRIWTKRVDERLHPMTSVLTYTASHRHTILDNNTPAQVEAIINETRDPVKRQRKREWIEMGMKAPTAREAVTEFAKTLTDMEATLRDRQWLAGDAYSLADVALMPYLNRLAMLRMDPFWQAYPGVSAWFDRMRARPSFEPALLKWVPDTLTRSLAENGERSWPEVEKMLAA